MNITLTDLLNIVSEASGVAVEDIVSKSRKADITAARHLFCLFASKIKVKEEKKLFSSIEIGKAINRNHSTFFCSLKTAKDLIKVRDKYFTQMFDKVVDNLTDLTDLKYENLY